MLADLFSLRSLARILAVTPLAAASARRVIIPPEAADKPSVVQWISKSHGLDSPKVLPINGTTYDWWYFDLVAKEAGCDEHLESITVVFYLSTAGGFTALEGIAQLGFTSVDLVQVTASFANGSAFETLLNASQATFSTHGDAAHGFYSGDTGRASFQGEADLSQYTVNIDAPELGIVGKIQLDSVAPPHYRAGPAKGGLSMEFMPHVGWANAIPDSNGRASLVINGHKWGFKGYGYHDKNWGDAPFSDVVGSWYWGHCRLGPYSIVWADCLAPNGKNFLTSYVAKHDKIIAAGPSGIKVRPFGQNSTYPPLTSTGAPTGFHVDVKVPKGKLSFKVTGDNIVGGASSYFYTRWVGHVKGGLNGANDLTGTALYEQFAQLDS